MYAKVIPAVRLPRELHGPFDYRVPEAFLPHVRRGSVVRVPWRGKEVDALVTVVAATSDAPDGKIKDLTGLGSLSSLTEEFVRIIEWTARYYFTSTGTVLKAVLPATPKRRIVREPTSAPAAGGARDASIRGGGRAIRYASAPERRELIIAEITEAAANGDGCIVIVPHAVDIGPMTADLATALPAANIVPYHGGLSAGNAWSAWQTMASGTGTVVVGTRQAAFAPLPRPGVIIIAECDSADLKQYDQNPRYDARSVAVERGKLSGARVVLMSHAPRAEDHALALSPGWEFAEQTPEEPETTLVGLSGLRGAHDRGPLPPTVMDAVDESLRNRKKVLIFLNRRGEAPALLCRDCGRVFRCPTCRVALAVHASGLHCHRCGCSTLMPLTCGDCGGPSLRRLGHGTASMERDLRAAFPEATVVRKDAELRDERVCDILIGTQLALHDIAEHGTGGPFGLVIAADTDGLLAHAGFRTTEDAWRTVRTLKDVAADGGARLILIAADPDDPGIRDLLAPTREFMRKELETRAMTGYPPSATLIAVIAYGDTEDRAMTSARELVRQLEPLTGDAASVHGPIRPSTPFRHGAWRSLAVVRARVLTEALVEHLARLPEGYVIDRDPEYLS